MMRCHTRMRPVAEKTRCNQPALPVQHPHIALGEKLKAHEPSKARMFIRAFIGHVLRLLRFLGQFAATGGPLS